MLQNILLFILLASFLNDIAVTPSPAFPLQLQAIKGNLLIKYLKELFQKVGNSFSAWKITSGQRSTPRMTEFAISTSQNKF